MGGGGSEQAGVTGAGRGRHTGAHTHTHSRAQIWRTAQQVRGTSHPQVSRLDTSSQHQQKHRVPAPKPLSPSLSPFHLPLPRGPPPPAEAGSSPPTRPAHLHIPWTRDRWKYFSLTRQFTLFSELSPCLWLPTMKSAPRPGGVWEGAAARRGRGGEASPGIRARP